jgi:hypothetical protein
METVLESVKLAFFVYGLAAGLSLVIAWLIKMIFVAVQFQKARAEARNGGGSGPDGEAPGGEEAPAAKGSS